MNIMDCNRLQAVTLGFLIAAISMGCAPVMQKMPFKKHMTRVEPKQPVGVETADVQEGPPRMRSYVYSDNPYEGSLWTPQNSRAHLFMDTKARYVNDIVTVKIIETADASRNATTKVARNGGLKSSILKFFGSPLDFGMENLWGKNTGASKASERTETPFKPEIETDSENSFSGTGTTVRKDKLIATVSAKVVEVYPNGNMVIEGRREVTINNEKQYIMLSGIIRQKDISPDNVVISTTIADAKIILAGKGIITDKQNPGWGHRVYDWVTPF